MNCKPDDIAVIVHGPFAGRYVDVLHVAPIPQATLPNGLLSIAEPSSWVVRSLGGPFNAHYPDGTRDITDYGVCPDWALRPIRPEPERESIPTHESTPEHA